MDEGAGDARGPPHARLRSRAAGDLPPGDYVWSVHHRNLNPSTPRRFTVEPVRLERLRAKARRSNGDYTFSATGVHFTVAASPYVLAELTLTGAGRATVERWRVGRRGVDSWTWDCGCRYPGARMRWELVVTDEFGSREVRRGSWQLASRARCASLARAERRERVAEARKHAARVERYLRDCRAAGGSPGTVTGRDGTRTLTCRFQ